VEIGISQNVTNEEKDICTGTNWNSMFLKKKVLLLGDGAVGKTSLIRKFVYDVFEDHYLKTIGAKVMKKNMICEGAELTMMIWDILGQRGFEKVQERHLKNCKGAILVADLTRSETLWSVTEYWVPMILKIEGKIPMIILANKADLAPEWEFDHDLLVHVAKGHNIKYMLTSAKSGLNVEIAFNAMGRELVLQEEKTM